MNTNIEEALEAIQSPKIRAIVSKSAAKYAVLMANQETELLKTLQNLEEDQKLTVSHSLTLDLGRSRQKDRVAFNVKHSVESEGEIPDPDQMDLPMEGGDDE